MFKTGVLRPQVRELLANTLFPLYWALLVRALKGKVGTRTERILHARHEQGLTTTSTRTGSSRARWPPAPATCTERQCPRSVTVGGHVAETTHVRGPGLEPQLLYFSGIFCFWRFGALICKTGEDYPDLPLPGGGCHKDQMRRSK